MPELAICPYLDGDRLSFYASSPRQDPLFMAEGPEGWRFDHSVNLFPRGALILLGQREPFSPEGFLLAAQRGMFGLRKFYESPEMPKWAGASSAGGARKRKTKTKEEKQRSERLEALRVEAKRLSHAKSRPE